MVKANNEQLNHKKIRRSKESFSKRKRRKEAMNIEILWCASFIKPIATDNSLPVDLNKWRYEHWMHLNALERCEKWKKKIEHLTTYDRFRKKKTIKKSPFLLVRDEWKSSTFRILYSAFFFIFLIISNGRWIVFYVPSSDFVAHKYFS